MMGELHAVSVSVGFKTSACRQTYGKSAPAQQLRLPVRMSYSMCCPTLKVFPAHKAGVDVDVGQRDGAKLLKVKVQNAPDGHTHTYTCLDINRAEGQT